MKRKFAFSPPPPADAPQRQPSDYQIDAARRILSNDHRRSYSQGAQGPTVRGMQLFLAHQGYAPGRFDGIWGKKTQDAFEQYWKDRGQSYTKATPENLAEMSKEAGQPLPRQRPVQPIDNLAVTASGDAGGVPPTDASMTPMLQASGKPGAGAAPPHAPPVIPPPTPDNWNIVSPEVQYGGGPGHAPTGPAAPPPTPSAPPPSTVADDFNIVSPEVRYGQGPGRAPSNPLRDALIGRDLLTGAPAGGRASPAQQAMAEALIARMAGR